MTSMERVQKWHREWLESDEPHWGDKIAWNTAEEIARRLDEPEERPETKGAACLKAGSPTHDGHYCTLEAGHAEPCHIVSV